MRILERQIIVSLSYFLLAALLGVVLRFFVILELPITYKFFVHAHSHIALLGWVYLALTTLLYKLFVQNTISDLKYKRIFWFTQFTLIGMLLTFPFTGYALFSIIFSTLFLFASYWFYWFFMKHVQGKFKKSNAFKCVKVALCYLVLSSLGPWALGIIMNVLGPESVWYRLSIYFYLHFLYNGWMIMALVAILFFIMEQAGKKMQGALFKRFFWSLNLGILFSFFLSTLFANPPISFNVLGGTGALFQLVAFGILWKHFTGQRVIPILKFSPFQKKLFKTVAFLLALKMLLQLCTALPYFANLAITHLDFTIAYLHWTFLGVVTLALFLFLNYFNLFRISTIGYLIYLIGFIVTEALIIYKGLSGWLNFSMMENFTLFLALGSLLIPIAITVLLSAGTVAKRI